LVIEAPTIAPQQLIPLPKDTLLCRQPHYSHKTLARKRTDPAIAVHPQRDLLVTILMQREAQITASIAKSRQTTQSALGSLTAHIKSRDISAPQLVPAVHPDGSIARPPWAFLKPLLAQTSLPKIE
jgi:hypothetical protein